MNKTKPSIYFYSKEKDVLKNMMPVSLQKGKDCQNIKSF